MPFIELLTKEQIEQLEPFEGIQQDRIFIPETPRECITAANKLCLCDVIGFDTETKPNFLRGQQSVGPHLIQFATDDYVVLFQLARRGSFDAARRVLESELTVKVGFGLRTDVVCLDHNLGVQTQAVVDLGSYLTSARGRNDIGTRDAVASVLNLRMNKSKKTTTSNWANLYLTDKQQLYAANDAYAALKVFYAMGEAECRAAIRGLNRRRF